MHGTLHVTTPRLYSLAMASREGASGEGASALTAAILGKINENSDRGIKAAARKRRRAPILVRAIKKKKQCSRQPRRLDAT